MKKIASYLIMATMILSVALIACDKPDDDECLCLFVNSMGMPIEGGDIISDEVREALIFMMYPNPAYEVVYLIFKTADSHTVTITNVNGKVLLDQSFDVDTETIAINVSTYPAGKYRVTVNNGKQKSTLCLVKKER